MRRLLLLVFFFVGTAFTHNTVQIEADYLAWFIKKNPVPPPLVTFASLDDAIPGALGQDHTRILLGKEKIGMGWMQGFDVKGKSWIHRNIGLEASYFLLPQVGKRKSSKTSGQPASANLATPFFDTTGVCGLNGVPGETIFVLPGPLFDDPFFFGLFDLHLSSQFQGAELNGFYVLKKEHRGALEWIWGARWFQLRESLKFKVDTPTVPNTPFMPGFSLFADRFRTTNNFVAGQMGLRGQRNLGRFHLEGIVKGALGANVEETKIRGSSKTSTGNVWFLTAGTSNETLHGGIFTQASNIGSRHKTPFAYAVETQLNSNLELTKHLSIDLGYTFLWISKVLRPGKQIDRNINSTRTALADASRATIGVGPGPIAFGTVASAPAPEGGAAPKARVRQSSFWAQGLNAGLTLTF